MTTSSACCRDGGLGITEGGGVSVVRARTTDVTGEDGKRTSRLLLLSHYLSGLGNSPFSWESRLRHASLPNDSWKQQCPQWPLHRLREVRRHQPPLGMGPRIRLALLWYKARRVQPNRCG